MLTRCLTIIICLTFFQQFLVHLVPKGSSFMILFAYVNRGHLANKIVSCHDSKNDLVFDILLFCHLKLDFFSDKILRIITLSICLFADWHHGLDIIDLFGLLIFDHGTFKGSWPDIQGGIVFADTFLTSIFHTVIYAVCTAHLLDDGPSILDVIFEVRRLKIENNWFFIEEVIFI